MEEEDYKDEDLIPAEECNKCGTMCCKGETFKNECVYCSTINLKCIKCHSQIVKEGTLCDECIKEQMRQTE